jgi:hypothetical protein
MLHRCFYKIPHYPIDVCHLSQSVAESAKMFRRHLVHYAAQGGSNVSQAMGGRLVAVGGATFKFKNKGAQGMGLDEQAGEVNVMGLEDKLSGSQLGQEPAERGKPMRVSLMIELPY